MLHKITKKSSFAKTSIPFHNILMFVIYSIRRHVHLTRGVAWVVGIIEYLCDVTFVSKRVNIHISVSLFFRHLRKIIAKNYYMSYQSVRTEQFRCHWPDLHELIFGDF